jgi:hypothetical protein
MKSLPGLQAYRPAGLLVGLSRRSGAGLAWSALVLTLAACQSAGVGRVPAAPAPAVELAVEADGLYEVPEALLTAAGLDLATPSGELLLTNDGKPVGFALTGQGKDRAVRFYGQGPGRDAYGSHNIYWLSRVAPGQAMPVQPVTIAARSAGGTTGVTPTSVVTSTVRAEEERQYYSQAEPIGDRWVWQTVFAPAEIQVPISTPHPADGESLLSLRLVGNSSAPVEPDHHLVLALNGAPVADAKWDGLGEHIITATVPAGTLRPGENSLTIKAPGDTGAPADSLLLDWVELTYPREMVLEGGSLEFAGRAGEFALRVSEKLAALWDITDPTRPVTLSDYVVKGDVLQFASDGASRRFIAVTEAGLRKPVAVRPASGPDPSTGSKAALDDWPGGADLIIVTVPQFREALQPLVDARRAQGMRVAVVDVGQVYDSFSHGEPGPEAIRALVEHARTHWTPPAPGYLLLAGDASYDPRGYLGGSEADLVPAQSVRTTFSGLTASDVWYGLADDGPTAVPVMAIGRFPAQTAEQLTNMVNKTLEYERGDQKAAWRDRALLLADGADPGFADAAKSFAETLKNFATETIASEGDGTSARRDLLRALDEGVGLVGYFGHGSVTLWAKEKVFGVEDVAKLANRDKLPIVFTVTCLSGFFDHPVTPSLGETLLRAGNGGAVAALVPSSAAVLSDQRLLAQGLADALATRSSETPEALGDIVLRAQRALSDTSPGVREVLLTFNLLGDPSLPLAR